MRYYDLTIGGYNWSSLINGQHNPYAQQIEFTIEVVHYNPSKSGESHLVIHGVPWELIDQAHNFAGLPVSISGGMSAGLPLATFQARPPLPGLLMEGEVLQCWGNWIGTEMSLGFNFIPGGLSVTSGGGGDSGGGGGGGGDSGGGGAGAQSFFLTEQARFNRTGPRSLDRLPFRRAEVARGPSMLAQPPSLGGLAQALTPLQQLGQATATVNGITISAFGGGGGQGNPLNHPINLVHDMKPGQPLASAVQQTLSKAFPAANIDVRIANATLAYQDSGMYQSMEQYSQYIQKLSNSILGTAGYLGAHFSSKDNTIHVWDGTVPVSETNVDPLDIIGQPTWIHPQTMSIKLVMRHDLDVGGVLYLPPTLMNLEAAAAMPAGAPQKTNLSFKGPFTIQKVTHIGDFRSPDSANWTTNIEATVPFADSDQINEAT